MLGRVDKKALFKVWNTFGPTIESTKWLGSKFHTHEDYYNYLCEFYGIDGGVMGLKKQIINEANEYLSNPDNLDCPGGTIRMFDIDLEKEMTSSNHMTWRYDGMYSKPFAHFAYEKDPNHQCENLDDFNLEDDPEEMCYDDECVRGDLFKVMGIIKKKYGISVNYSTVPESDMRGNIRIKKYK